VEQSLMPVWVDCEAQRAAVLSGAWTVLDGSQQPGAGDHNQVHIWATGVMVREAIKAANDLQLDGVHASVLSCVSPDLIFRSWHSLAGRGGPPVVTVLDGHPSALAWVGAMLGVRGEALGVTGYGQSGTPADLYREFGMDAEAISLASFRVLGD
jgi:pyruvate dehydrogenase E1 component